MKKITTENHVKALVREWYKKREGLGWATVQNGLGIHGIHDRTGAIPIVITPAMVGKRIGLFVSVESKRPGRRNEPDRGMSKHQVLFMEAVLAAGGLSICCDGEDDLAALDAQIIDLVTVSL